MIVVGLYCSNCGASIIDNPDETECFRCHVAYSEQVLKTIAAHCAAKKRLFKRQKEPTKAVYELASASPSIDKLEKVGG